jgi:hypothetical protein
LLLDHGSIAIDHSVPSAILPIRPAWLTAVWRDGRRDGRKTPGRREKDAFHPKDLPDYHSVPKGLPRLCNPAAQAIENLPFMSW